MSDEVNKNENLNRSKENTKGLNDEILSQDEKRIKFLEDIQTLVGDTNDDLSSNLSLQRDITSQLVQLRKERKGYNEQITASISLSKQVEKALKNSVNAGQNIEQIERAIIKNNNTRKQIQQQINAISTVNGKTDKEILDNAIKYSNAKKELVSSTELEQKLLKEVQTSQSTINDKTARNKDIQLELEKIHSERIKGDKLSNDIADNKIEKLVQEAKENESIISSSQKDLPTQLEKLAAQEKITDSKREQFNIAEEALPVEEKQAVALADSASNIDDANSKLREELAILKEIRNAMGLGGQAVAAINKLFGGQLTFLKDVKKNSEKILRDRIEERKQHNLIQKELVKKGEITEEEAEYLDENLTKLEGFTVQVVEAGKALKEHMLDPIVLIGVAMSYDKQLNELSKQLGTSEKRTREIRDNFRSIAFDVERVGIASSDMVSTANMLNQELGTAFRPDTGAFKELIGDVAVLTKMMGLSEEAATGFFRAAVSGHQTVEEIKLESLGVITAIEQQSGVLLDNVAILETAGKVTGQIRAQLGDSIQEIVKAEAEARKFGMTLQAVAAAGDQLLNFEQSISNELEAELLLGKQLNLEKARLAALTGDYATLTEEINANVGDFSDFQDLNVLQQRALADAVGMTVDGLSDQLMAKEDLAELAQEARAAGDEEKAQALERRAVEEKFKDVVHDIKAAFVDIAGGPIGDILRFVADIAGWIGRTVKMISDLTAGFSDWVIKGIIFYKIMQSIVGTFKTMKALSISIAAWRAKTLGTEVATEGVKKKGLITDRLRDWWSKSTLSTSISQASTEFMINLRKKHGLALDRMQDWWKKSILGTAISQTFQEGAQNAAKGAGNTLTMLRDWWEKSILSTKLGQNIQEVALNAYKTAGNVLTGIRDVLEKSILGTLVTQGLRWVFNVGKALVMNALRGVQAVLEGTILGSMIAQSAQALIHIARGAVKLAIAVATSIAKMAALAAETLGVGVAPALIGAAIAAAVIGAIVVAAYASAPKKKAGGEIIGPPHETGGVMVNAEGGEFMVNKQAASSIGPKNLETINKGKLPTTNVNQAVVQNNKVMEEKLDGVIAGLKNVANKTNNVQAYVVDDPDKIPSLTDYNRNYTNASVMGGGDARVGLG